MKKLAAKIPILILAVIAMLGMTITASWGGALRLTEAGRLFDYISTEDEYQDWNLWPGQEELARSSGPHGFWTTTYVNNIAYAGIIYGDRTLPSGSIIVNENYSFDGELKVIKVMYKESGYNPGGDDWFFAMYGPMGDVRNEGKVDLCLSCHRQAGRTDFLLTDYPDGHKGFDGLALAGAPGLAVTR